LDRVQPQLKKGLSQQQRAGATPEIGRSDIGCGELVDWDKALPPLPVAGIQCRRPAKDADQQDSPETHTP
jgi:hypothetical protein